MIHLKNKYVIGTHVMFYEIEVYKDFINGLLNMIETVENKENVFIDLYLNLTEYLEELDHLAMSKTAIVRVFDEGLTKLLDAGIPIDNLKTEIEYDKMYYHTDYRRDLNYNYCRKVDYVIWGETDSLIPREALNVIESLSEYTTSQNKFRYILCFADRKMWDNSWDDTVHVDYVDHIFEDTADGHLHPKQAKSKMSIDEMNTINAKVTDFDFRLMPYTKIDGSFLVISSQLIQSGVNIPPCLLYNDDEGFAISYNQLYKGNVEQYVCKNVLKVHARRHPLKRMYVRGEDNQHSFGGKKGSAFHIFKDLSQQNIQMLHSGVGKFHNYEAFMAITGQIKRKELT